MASLNAIQLILLVVVGQGLFLTFTLSRHKKGDQKANKLLALAVFLMTYFTFVFLLNDSGYRRYVPILILNGYSITPLIPVIFYFYFRQLINGGLGKYYLLHFIPFFLQFVYWFPNNTNGLFFQLSADTMSFFYSLPVVRAVSGLHIFLFVIYGIVFFKKLSFDQLGNNLIGWLKKVRLLYTLMVIVFAFGLFSIWFTNTEVVRYLFFFFLSFFIYLIGYQGYTQNEKIFSARVARKPKYHSSGISREQSMLIYETLLQLMKEEKPYLKRNIKLSEIAHRIETTPHHLSRVINENYEGNFLDFINKYRIEEAKCILLDEDTRTLKMFAVALESGFGNKVSFYKSFRKFTGQLPSEFKINHQRFA